MNVWKFSIIMWCIGGAMCVYGSTYNYGFYTGVFGNFACAWYCWLLSKSNVK